MTGELAYYFTDHLGTPLLQTNASATVVWRAEHEPYGTVHSFRAGTVKYQPLRFPGQEAGDSELAYNIFRWYRDGWGRYSQADPIGLLESDRNPYRYALSNPVTFVDVLGLDVRVCCRKVKQMFPISAFDHCYIESNANGRRKSWGLYVRDVLMPDNRQSRRSAFRIRTTRQISPHPRGNAVHGIKTVVIA